MEASKGFGLRPRSIGEILDLVFRIYKVRFRQFAGIGIVLSFAGYLGSLLCLAILFPGFQSLGAGDPSGMVLTAIFPGFVLVWAITMVVETAAAIIGSAITEDALLGRASSVREILGKSLARVPTALATSFLLSAPVLFGLCLCLVPGLVIGLLLIFAVPLCYLERRSAVSAMTRSYELIAKRGPTGFSTKSNWVRVVLVGLVVFGAAYALQAAISFPLMILGIGRAITGQPPHQTPIGPQYAPLWIVLPLQVLIALGQGVLIMLRSIPWTILYYDILTRYEGRDIEMAMSALDSGQGEL